MKRFRPDIRNKAPVVENIECSSDPQHVDCNERKLHAAVLRAIAEGKGSRSEWPEYARRHGLVSSFVERRGKWRCGVCGAALCRVIYRSGMPTEVLQPPWISTLLDGGQDA